jgi:hypothetical protein
MISESIHPGLQYGKLKGSGSEKYECRVLSGEVHEYFKKVFEYLKENIPYEEWQKKFHYHIWVDLRDFERNIDAYAQLLGLYNINDSTHFFPDVYEHVNVVARLMSNLLDERKNYPILATELALKLETEICEFAQLACIFYEDLIKKAWKEYCSEEFKGAISYSKISGIFFTFLMNNREEYNFRSMCEESERNHLPQIFEQLEISKKRKNRLETSQALLSCLFEHEKTLFEQLTK